MRWKERAWTKDEVVLLRELYPLGTKRKILGKISGRSWSAIVGKASSLKIRRLRTSEPFP